jgi:hypothetical protein
MDKWEIARSSGVCAVSGRPLAEGEEYYVVLFEDGETFRRADYSMEGWAGPPQGAFCYFKSKVPTKKPKRQLWVDDDLLINFFLRLADETDESRLRFRFVLSLILMRKRILRYEQTVRQGDRESWRMRLTQDQTVHQVLNPQLTDEQVEGLSRQLGAILHGDMGEFADAAESWAEEADARKEADHA